MKFLKNTLMQKMSAAVAVLVLLACPTAAYSAGNITEAFTGGKTTTNLRYRYETVDENNTKKNAAASTVRLRLGYETAAFHDFGVTVEAEHLTALGGESYNSGANGKTTYSTVVDPEFTEMNEAYLRYRGVPKTFIKYGRQRLILDNARFIGNVGWRQNEQTFDAFTVVNQSLPDTKITAGYINNVNRVFSDNAIATSGAAAGNHKMKSPILNVNYKGWGFGEVVGYGYFLDYGLPAANYANSTKTYGLRLKGSSPLGENTLLYTAEYATQSNYKDNPASYSNDYTLLEGGVDIKIADFKLGYEVLGSNGTRSFSTPLATLHAFNGWADMFLATPATGLKNTYLSAGTVLSDVKLEAVYHDFRADTGGSQYGTEWNLAASKAFTKNFLLGAKYGSFNTKSAPRVDTDKFWLWAEAKF